MELRTNLSVDISLQMSKEENRPRIQAWFERLKNWDNDAAIRKLSDRLPGMDVYVLRATDGFRIFFKKDSDTITILDIATKETIDLFASVE